MTPRPETPEGSARPDTEDAPVHARRKERNEVAVSERGRFWTGETVVGAIGLTLTIGALIGHAFVLNDHVTQLEGTVKDHLADVQNRSRQNDARMTAIEANVASNAAAADKGEALLRQQLQGISDKLDDLQKSVDALPHHH